MSRLVSLTLSSSFAFLKAVVSRSNPTGSPEEEEEEEEEEDVVVVEEEVVEEKEEEEEGMEEGMEVEERQQLLGLVCALKRSCIRLFSLTD